jgi:hypothetical protein
VYNHGPPDTLQIFSIKVGPARNLGGMDGLRWPLHVFDLIALRDSIDQHRNVIFNRTRDDYQIITKHVSWFIIQHIKLMSFSCYLMIVCALATVRYHKKDFDLLRT